MTLFFKALVFLIVTTSVIRAQTNIAVIDFLAKGVSKTEASIITDKFRNSIVNLDSLKVFEREIVDQILKEQGFQQTGIIADESIVELGKLMGVEQIISGSVSHLSETYTVTAKIIDVKTGEILKSSYIDHMGSLDDLLNQMDLLAFQLFGNFPKTQSYSSEQNGHNQKYTPIQIALIHPIQIFSESITVKGLSINLIYGIKKSVYGFDLGVGNILKQEMYGIQAGLVNNSSNVIGVQAGLVNSAEKVRGLQAGLINTTDVMFGLQIGLINKIKSGPFPFVPFINMAFSL